MNQSRGFTLLEVVIAVTLMAFLSFFTAQAIQRALQAKTKIQKEIDRDVELREALNFMVRDIQLAFNYRDIGIELFNQAQKAKAADANKGKGQSGQGGQGQGQGQDQDGQGQDQSGQPGVQPKPPEQKEDKLVTQFIGEEDKLDFASLSGFRTQQDQPISEQSEVGYYIDDCSSRRQRGKRTKCLWRRSSPYIDDNPTEGGSATPILENVTEMSLRYIGPEHEEEWIRSWRSDGQQEQSMGGNFPYAVEITLEVQDDRYKPPRQIAMTRTAEIRFPNNKKKEDPNSAATSGPAGGNNP